MQQQPQQQSRLLHYTPLGSKKLTCVTPSKLVSIRRKTGLSMVDFYINKYPIKIDVSKYPRFNK